MSAIHDTSSQIGVRTSLSISKRKGHQYYVAYLRLARYSRTGLERSQEHVYTTWFRGMENSIVCAFVGTIHCQNAIKAALYVLCNRAWHFVSDTRWLARSTDSNRSFASSYANACTRNSLQTVETFRTCNAITSPTRMLDTIA